MQNEQGLYGINAELNPICYLLALLGAHHILHVSRIRVNPIALLSEVLVFLNSQCRIFAEQFAVIQLIKATLRFAVSKYLFIRLYKVSTFSCAHLTIV
jgi:hypothetical protein